jgi:uncharacterized membrane protein
MFFTHATSGMCRRKKKVALVSGILEREEKPQFKQVCASFESLLVVSPFIVPYYKSVFVLTGFSALLALVGFTAITCWSLFGAAFQKILVNNNRTVNIVMSLLLLYCAVSLFL